MNLAYEEKIQGKKQNQLGRMCQQANPADRKPRGGLLLSLRHFTAAGKFWLGAPLCLRPLIRSVGRT